MEIVSLRNNVDKNLGKCSSLKNVDCTFKKSKTSFVKLSGSDKETTHCFVPCISQEVQEDKTLSAPPCCLLKNFKMFRFCI